jgi:hypothetical protein
MRREATANAPGGSERNGKGEGMSGDERSGMDEKNTAKWSQELTADELERLMEISTRQQSIREVLNTAIDRCNDMMSDVIADHKTVWLELAESYGLELGAYVYHVNDGSKQLTRKPKDTPCE